MRPDPLVCAPAKSGPTAGPITRGLLRPCAQQEQHQVVQLEQSLQVVLKGVWLDN